MNSKLQAWCDSLLELCWLAALVISPLFFNVHSDRVFEPDKITLVRSIAVVMIAVWAIRFVDQRGWENLDQFRWRGGESVWRKPFVLPMLAIAGIYIISTIFSVTPAVSWAGSYQRLQGTYTTLSYIVIFLIMIATIRNDNQVQRIVTTAIIISIPVALYGMLQRLNLDPLPWGGDTSRRIAGHMGNAIFLAAWLIMVTPLTLGRIISSFTSILSDEDLNIADIIRSSIYIFVISIQAMAIYWTFSRGPLLGLLAGIFVFVTIFLVTLRNIDQDESGFTGRDIFFASLGFILGVFSLILAGYLRPTIGDFGALGLSLGSIGLYAIAIFVMVATRTGWRWLWLSWLLLAFYAAIWLGIFNTYDLASDNLSSAPVVGQVIGNYEAWREIPGVGRYGTLLNTDSRTGKVRIYIWRGALELILPHEPLEFPDGTQDSLNFMRPLIGYGPEAMYVAYNRFYPPLLGTVEARNASPDRSHNETWDAFVITGLLGFLAWQWLYVSIFNKTFSWLGVVQSKRDSYLLVGLWIVIGLIVGGVFSAARGVEFFGVAFPAGSILGLIIYLVIYSLGRTARDSIEIVRDPFDRNTLTMVAVIGSIIAFYVEIHFGIAIVSTRTYFFAYTAILFALGYALPASSSAVVLAADVPTDADATELVETKPSKKKGKKRKGRSSRSSSRSGSSIRGGQVGEWVRPAFIWMFVLTMMYGALSFNYTVFTPPPDLQIRSLADLPSAWDIFQQSMFINPRESFSESPFIFLVMMMSWLLGSLIALSEMSKNGLYKLAGHLTYDKTRASLAGYVLLGLSVLLVGLFLYGYFINVQNLSDLARIGYITLSPLGALIAGFAGIRLINQTDESPAIAASTGVAAMAISLPIMLAGGTVSVWLGLITFGMGGLLLALFWSKPIGSLVYPALIVAVGSLLSGLMYQFVHATRIRRSFIRPDGVANEALETVLRVAEADQFSTILGLFYVFTFTALVGFAVLVNWDRFRSRLGLGFPPAFLALVILLPLSLYMVNVSNLRIIQADIIYKRGKPWDNEATRSRENPELASRLWDNSIAIYERALELAPREDFYYLWLGRAYLEKSSYLDGEARDQILSTAENSLFIAQDINPLNTDHTANLARLNSRWASLEAADSIARSERVGNATSYYESAIALSPQNSGIYNEFARMTFAFTQECETTLDIYRKSTDADPLYSDTQFQLSEALAQCALREDEGDRQPYLDQMLEAVAAGVEVETSPGVATREWYEVGQRLQQLGGYDEAVQAYDNALGDPTDEFPEWQIQFVAARAHLEAGDLDDALSRAESALEVAPADVAPQIQTFIDEL
ncbi:MAG: tetratricopeptide repeat protein [Chloroflexota bacterium]